MRLQFYKGNQIINRYAADGRKLGTEYFTRVIDLSVPLITGQVISQVYTINVINQNGTAYVDNKEYNTFNGNSSLTALQRIYNSEGFADTITATIPNYKYYRRDHLGNNRELWVANTKKTLQRTQYYPSGLPIVCNTGDNPGVQERKYNGKEFVEMHGYDTYDYGARGYYPAMGRFTSVDPMAEKYYSTSPYAYCAGNPVNRIDPNGMDWIKNKDTGKVEWRPDATKDHLPEGYSYVGTEYMGITITKFETTKNEYTNGQKDTNIEIEIGYKDPKSNKKDGYNWVQTKSRDGQDPTVDYDSKSEEGKSNFPYYQPEDENKKSRNKDGFDITFHDQPNELNKKGSFNAELSLIGETDIYKNISMVHKINIPVMTGKTLSTIFTLKYGFSGSNVMLRVLPITVINTSNFQLQTIKEIK